MAFAVEMKGITKRFGTKVLANDNVDLELNKGEILSLLGENGSGKTTLMNMLAGIYYPDEGQIFVDGEEVVIRSPFDAFSYKIGMVHQHFKLVDVFSAADNIILGEKCPDKNLWKRIKFNWLSKNHTEKLQTIAEKYGFEIDLKKKVYDMSVSEKQTVEIIKVLYRGADGAYSRAYRGFNPAGNIQTFCGNAQDERGRQVNHNHNAQAERGYGDKRPRCRFA